MQVIINFLEGAAKIVFGSAVVGFFVPGLAGRVSQTVFISGMAATVLCLLLAVFLSGRIKDNKA